MKKFQIKMIKKKHNNNNNNNNETTESPLLAHVIKSTSPIKVTKNIRLPSDLNIIFLSSTSASSTMTTSTYNTSSHQKDEYNSNGIKYRRITTLYCYSRNMNKIRGALVNRG